MNDDEGNSFDEVRRLLHHALFALVVGDVTASELFAEDVRGDSTDMCVRSRTELEYRLEDRACGLSNVEFALDRVDKVSAGWLATWRLCGDQTGEVFINEDEYFPPTGRRIILSATTHFDVRECRIRAFRTNYDGGDLVGQIRHRPGHTLG